MTEYYRLSLLQEDHTSQDIYFKVNGEKSEIIGINPPILPGIVGTKLEKIAEENVSRLLNNLSSGTFVDTN